MNQSIINTILFAGMFLTLFAFAEMLYHIFKIKVEKTRKIVHIGTGLITLLFPLMIDNHWLILALCSSFLLILQISLRFNLLKSINSINRVSRGSIVYPVAVYSVYLVYAQYDSLLFFYLPILILSISDPLACLAGKKWPKGKYRIGSDTKTLLGSLVFFVSAMLLSVVLLIMFSDLSTTVLISISMFIALSTTVAESISQKGYDNLFIPLTALLVIIAAENFSLII